MVGLCHGKHSCGRPSYTVPFLLIGWERDFPRPHWLQGNTWRHVAQSARIESVYWARCCLCMRCTARMAACAGSCASTLISCTFL